MGTEPWYRWPVGAFKALVAGAGWEMFCWATGYRGFVCDFAGDEQLPCEKWFECEGGKR